MFGYIKCYTPELKVRENEYYGAIYCGICRSLGRCTGVASKLTLSYDSVILALLRISATGALPEFGRHRCPAHPLSKRAMAKNCPELDYAARVGVLLAYHKAEDDVSDERGGKRFGARLLRSLMRGMRRRAAKALREADELIISGLSELSEIEKKREPSVDIPADCFGRMMGKILGVGIEGREKRILSDIGLHLGRWLYIVDAVDDLADDAKKGRYNPIALLYGTDRLDDYLKKEIFDALSCDLIEAEAALDLIDVTDKTKDAVGIVYNIVRFGMPQEADRVLNKLTKGGNSGKNEQSV